MAYCFHQCINGVIESSTDRIGIWDDAFGVFNLDFDDPYLISRTYRTAKDAERDGFALVLDGTIARTAAKWKR